MEKLENLIFDEKDGSNPICSYETYYNFISDNLIQIKMLDNQDIKIYTQNNCYFPNEDYSMGNSHNPKSNVNHNIDNVRSSKYPKQSNKGNYSKNLLFYK